MSTNSQLTKYKRHLEERYKKLIERSKDYKYVDEVKSDLASYKAMRIQEKLNKVRFLDNSLI